MIDSTRVFGSDQELPSLNRGEFNIANFGLIIKIETQDLEVLE